MSDPKFIDIVFVVVTGIIAYHGITYRSKEGQPSGVHMFFGSIALLYCLTVLGKDILGLF
ncbi:MAG: hypothetical protein HQM14_05530 [SAR324 cluster bacterium]|nr:hypothetical protein [SAR324 cluster bacterium]